MIVGFSGFGFPKAHGAAFGLLAYQSTWLRVHYGPEFLCALLNEQPMGFYAPDTLAHEAQRRGIELAPPDVNASEVECTVEAVGPPARVRLGLGYVLGVRADEVEALVAARAEGGPFRSLADLASRAGRGPAGAGEARVGGRVRRAGGGSPSTRGARRCGSSASPRRASACREGTQLALPLEVPAAPALRPLDAVGGDGRRLRDHRADARPAPDAAAARRRCRPATVSSADLARLPHDTPVRIGGLVVARQRPGTAKGIVFMLLEDEFGTINLIVPPPVYERHRLTVRTEPLIMAEGRLERLPQAGGAINVFVARPASRWSTPEDDAADVVALAERRAAAAAAGAPAARADGPTAASTRPTSAASRRPSRASRPGGDDEATGVPRRREPCRFPPRMTTLIFVLVWVVLGLGLLLVALSGGPGGARQRLMSQSRGGRRVAIVLFVARPARARRRRAGGGDRGGRRQRRHPGGERDRPHGAEKHGRELFGRRCANCHTLEAANAVARGRPEPRPAAPEQGARARRDREGPRERQRPDGGRALHGRGRRGRRELRRQGRRRRPRLEGESGGSTRARFRRDCVRKMHVASALGCRRSRCYVAPLR